MTYKEAWDFISPVLYNLIPEDDRVSKPWIEAYTMIFIALMEMDKRSGSKHERG